MSTPKLMLFVNGRASEHGIGNIFLNDLCAVLSTDKLCRFSTVRDDAGVGTQSWGGRPVRYFHVTVSTVPVLSSVSDEIFKRTQEARLVTSAVQFGREHSVEGIWAVFNSTYIIRSALAVAQALDVPLFATIWDPPDVFRINMHLNHRSYQNIYRIFQETLKRSTSVSVIGESMARHYKQELGILSVPLAHGYRSAEYLPDQEPFRDGKVKIAFAGSLYSKSEWRALLRALDTANYRISGREIELHFIGRRPLRGVPMPKCVIRHGVLSPEETLIRLRGLDIGYLPYWFDPRFETVARLAFPSKSAVYLAAGCRLFYHGPHYGSPTEFLKKYRVGMPCHSLSAGKIVEAIEMLCEEMNSSQLYSSERLRARDEMLSREAMATRFAEFIGDSSSNVIASRDRESSATAK